MRGRAQREAGAAAEAEEAAPQQRSSARGYASGRRSEAAAVFCGELLSRRFLYRTWVGISSLQTLKRVPSYITIITYTINGPGNR